MKNKNIIMSTYMESQIEVKSTSINRNKSISENQKKNIRKKQAM